MRLWTDARGAAAGFKRALTRREIERDMARRPITDAGRIRKLTIEPTVVCNLRCPHCWWWGKKGDAFRLVEEKHESVVKPLRLGEVYSIMREVHADLPQIYFSGGEPFSRPDFIDMVEAVDTYGLTAGFTTNATLFRQDTAARLSRVHGLDWVTVSVDGPEDVHDSIRGKGNYRRTMKAVRDLVDARASGGSPNRIGANSTLTRAILGRTEEMVRDCAEAGFDDLNFQHLWFTDAATAEAHRQALKDDFGVDDRGAQSHVTSLPGADYGRAIVEEFLRVRRNSPLRLTMSPRLTPDDSARYYSDLTWAAFHYCLRPWEGLIVKAGGDVVFCPDQWISEAKIGNIREHGLIEIWNGPKAALFRAALARRTLYPACGRCCVLNLEAK